MSAVSNRKFLYFKLYINNLGNGVFKALTFSDFSTSDDIKLVCQKMFSALPTSGICYRVRMKPTPSGTTADAYVYCASSNYGFVHIRDHGGTDYYGRVQNGTWTWDSYALKSDLTDIIMVKSFRGTSITIAENASEKISIPISTPTGYKVVGKISEMWINGPEMYLSQVDLTPTTFTGFATNLRNSEATSIPTISVLFVKS